MPQNINISKLQNCWYKVRSCSVRNQLLVVSKKTPHPQCQKRKNMANSKIFHLTITLYIGRYEGRYVLVSMKVPSLSKKFNCAFEVYAMHEK